MTFTKHFGKQSTVSIKLQIRARTKLLWHMLQIRSTFVRDWTILSTDRHLGCARIVAQPCRGRTHKKSPIETPL